MVWNTQAKIVHGRVHLAQVWSSLPSSMAAQANAKATENPT